MNFKDIFFGLLTIVAALGVAIFLVPLIAKNQSFEFKVICVSNIVI